ncbi:MAG: hypothetical protein ABSF18_06885 [Gammaproteobacteria bacterium]
MRIQVVISSCVFFLALVSGILFFFNSSAFVTTPDKSAFLGAKFDMTIEEVQNILNKNDTKMVDFAVFNEMYPNLDGLFLGAMSKNRESENEYLYMLPIGLFNSSVYAQFTFSHKKLSHVEAYFLPYPNADMRFTKEAEDKVVNQITTALNEKYRLVDTSHDKDIPGSYMQKFEGKGRLTKLTFLVNPSAKSRAFRILLWISYRAADEQNKMDAVMRQKMAF